MSCQEKKTVEVYVAVCGGKYKVQTVFRRAAGSLLNFS